MNVESESGRFPAGPMILFAVVFMVMLGFAAGKLFHFLDPLVAKRGAAASIGLQLVIFGNLVPKFRAISAGSRESARSIAADRFAGWVLVAAGFTFAGLWLFAPLDRAAALSPLAGGAAFVASGGYWIWAAVSARRGGAEPSTPPSNELSASVRRMIIVILAGIFGTMLIFLADWMGGDDASRMLAVIFAIAIPILGVGVAVHLHHRPGHS